MAHERELLKCHGCGAPLGERRGDVFNIRKMQGGQVFNIQLEVQHPNGVVYLRCGTCKKGPIFVTLTASKKTELAKKKVA